MVSIPEVVNVFNDYEFSRSFVFLSMLFMHIYADFNLQTVLADMKVKEWWTNQKGYEYKYRYDFLVSMVCHSMQWSFCIMLPIAIKLHFRVGAMFVAMFIINIIIHSSIDNAKANERSINLLIDQIFHLMQIMITFIMLI